MKSGATNYEFWKQRLRYQEIYIYLYILLVCSVKKKNLFN
jgi:hypothetical protein